MNIHAKFLISSDEATRVETDTGTWILDGVRVDDLETCVREAAAPSDVKCDLPQITEDAVAVNVAPDGKNVRAFRSVTSTRDLYYLWGSDGSAVLTDHFRNAVAELDVEDREVTESAVADHLLFRGPIEPDTYLSRVSALEHGTWLEWNLDADERSREQVDVLSTDERLTPTEAVGRIDRTLACALNERCDEETSVMLSGGVDSTLLQTYLRDRPACILGIDAAEFAFEMEYAEEAKELLDVSAREVTLQESDLLAHLERSMDALGFPSHYAQTVLTDALLREDTETKYVNGEGADALFGRNGTKGCRIAAWFDTLLRTGVPRALAPDGEGVVNSLSDTADRLHRPVTDPHSFAQQFAFYTDFDLAGEMVGTDLVADRTAAQATYLRERIADRPEGRFGQQIEFGHLLSFLRHNTVNQWRQLGYVHGKQFSAPFKTRTMAENALAVPAAKRYVQGARGVRDLRQKYLLKNLLDFRLLGYDTDREKGSGALPLARYFDEGPLADVFERYDPPAFVPDGLHAAHVESFGPLTWNLLTYAVWRDRILENPAVERVEGTREITPLPALSYSPRVTAR